MKKKLLKSVMVVCAMLLGMNLHAQDDIVLCPMGKQMQTAPSVGLNCQMSQMPDHAKVHQKVEEDVCSVTLDLVYDEMNYRNPGYAYLINQDYEINYAFLAEQSQLNAQVSPGVYDIVVYFVENSTTSVYVVIREQVDVAGDTTLTLSTSECVNQITMKCYGPDGELLKNDLAHFDEASGDFIIDEVGNVFTTYCSNRIKLKGFLGSVQSWSTLFVGPQLSEGKRYGNKDFFVNDVSDRWLFTQARIAVTEDATKAYCNYYSTDNVKIGTLESIPENYNSQVYDYKYTPYGYSQERNALQIVFWGFENNELSYVSGMQQNNLISPKQGKVSHTEIWINVPQSDPCYPDLELLLQPSFAENNDIIEPSVWTLGSPIRVKDGQKEFVNLGHQNQFFGVGMQPNLNFYMEHFMPAPQPLTYPVEKVLGVFNNNCPINALNVQDYAMNDQMNLSMTSYYVGRYGETTFCNQGSTTDIKYNGEEVGSMNSSAEKGVYEVVITNPNIEVDDIPGHNTTTVYFDQNQEDMTPPSIEMLHFKNAEGGVIDRFATAADGMMEFYAGDFNYYYYPESFRGEYDCQPVDVMVEYAPYGTEDWSEIAVEEVPELYQMPGWGYFYRGSLAGVTGQAEKGWFDIKFRLVDEAGNWQEQVVSPAFRIDDLAYSSVATVGSGNAHEVARYNLAGQRVDASHQGVTIIKMSDGTARKVIN